MVKIKDLKRFSETTGGVGGERFSKCWAKQTCRKVLQPEVISNCFQSSWLTFHSEDFMFVQVLWRRGLGAGPARLILQVLQLVPTDPTDCRRRWNWKCDIFRMIGRGDVCEGSCRWDSINLENKYSPTFIVWLDQFHCGDTTLMELHFLWDSLCTGGKSEGGQMHLASYFSSS